MDAPDSLVTALADRYRIGRELGQGGMATVYLAEDLRHDRKVAVKVLKPELAAVVGGARFIAEIRTTANLQHPHILPLFDSGEADGVLWYAMPFVEGETLGDRIGRERQMPIADAVAIVSKVLAALGAAHERGIIHRDVKPANVLIDTRGEPLIADFGIALALREAGGGRLTETGLSLGTPHYMSPEQATGDRDLDARSDLYSVGCMLYEMLTGEPPFSGATAQAIVGRILTAEPAPPTEARRSIPPNVEAAVLTALEKAPADRFQRADEFVRALKDPGFAHARLRSDAGAPARRRGVSPGVFGGTLVLAATAVALTAVFAGGRSATPATPVTYRVDLPDDLRVFTNHGIGLALSPDGATLVFQAGGTNSGLWIRRPGELAPQALPVTSYAVHPRFSPDGRSIVYVGGNDGDGDGRGLRTMSLDGSVSRVLVPDSVETVFGGVAWGDDGFIYFVRRDGSIWRVPATGGVTEVIMGQGTHGDAGAVDALPGGRGLLFTASFPPPVADTIRVMDLESREVRSLFPGTAARWVDSGHLVFVDRNGVLYRIPFDLERLAVSGPAVQVGDGIDVPREPSAQFAVSRSGSLAYAPATSGNLGAPVWLDGSGPPIPLPGLPPDLPVGHATVSPDGRRIALLLRTARRDEVAVFDLDDRSLTPIASHDHMGKPFWSPRGNEVGYWGRDDGDSVGSLYSRPVDLSAEARRLWSVAGPAVDAVTSIFAQWTPAGDRLIIMVSRGEILSVAPLPDSSSTVLVGGVGRGSLADFDVSPNGDWLAYGDGRNVLIRPMSGARDVRQVSRAGGSDSQWLPSGDAIMYAARPGWRRVNLGSATDPRLVSDELWFDGSKDNLQENSFDIAPDGRLLTLLNYLENQAARAPIVVVNWNSQFEPAGDRR